MGGYRDGFFDGNFLWLVLLLIAFCFICGRGFN